MIRNPILPGFNPDPCICRKGEDYFLAVSSFEWFPGIPVYHSRDLKNWELYCHVLTDDTQTDLRQLPSAKGIWAPCLSYCEEEGLFYVIYGMMNSMNARYFDVDNYLITAADIRGPWSEPVYLHSAGFDASIFHERDGSKWIVSLEWETRDGYEKPGAICLAQYDPKAQKILGYPKRIWSGSTDRGCIEAPHLTFHDGYYYLMCAEGGTGYNHAVTMARSKDISGPYEPDPHGVVLSSQPEESNERSDPDHLKPKYYNPGVLLQKAGHGSYVETQDNEIYLAYLCSRPLLPELCCTLGRETAIQKAHWTQDGWLRLDGGDILPQVSVAESGLPPCPFPKPPVRDDFEGGQLDIHYYAPRQHPGRFADLSVRPGWLCLRGQESLTSLNRVSLLARKLTGLYGVVTTKMEFSPQIYQHSAGLVLYYDNMNYAWLRKTWSQSLAQPIICLTRMKNGLRQELITERIPVMSGPLLLRLRLNGREGYFSWCYEGQPWQEISANIHLAEFSDEFCQYGEFTGTFVGLACEDRMFHRQTAAFSYFDYDVCEGERADDHGSDTRNKSGKLADIGKMDESGSVCGNAGQR